MSKGLSISAQPKQPHIFVVIPSWNGIEFIADCLNSLRTQTCKHQVIVVENGSTDGSVELITAQFPEVRLLLFKDNAGFAGGVNRGIRPALDQGADYIALLNNDAVADSRWLEVLVAEAETDSAIGMVTAKITTRDGTRIDSTGDFYSAWGFPYPRGRGEIDSGQYDNINMRDVFAASGGASLYRATMLRQIGLFDERFFAYFEDIDICFRARLAGWVVRYAPAATVRHYIGGTSSRMHDTGDARGAAIPNEGHARPSTFARFHTVKNFSYVYTKNMPTRLYWKYWPKFCAGVGMMLISDARRGLLWSNLKAHLEVVRNFPGIMASRRDIQAARSISIEAVDSVLEQQLPPLQQLRFKRLLRKGRTS